MTSRTDTKMRSGTRKACGLVLLLATMIASSGLAMAGPGYLLEVETEPYVPLSQGAFLQMPWGPDMGDPYIYLDLGNITFHFFDVDYPLTSTSKMGVSRWGSVQFAGPTSATIIGPFLTGLDSVAPEAQVRYVVEGEPGDHIIKIEWSHVGFPHCPPEIGTSFQLWLYQRSGVFELRYDETEDLCDSAYYGTGTGPYVGIFRGSRGFDRFYEIVSLAGDPAQPDIVGDDFPFLDDAPAAGTVYRFIPTAISSVRDRAEGEHPARVIPNPAGDRTTFEFTIGRGTDVTLDLYDAGGRHVRSILDEHREAGNHAVEFDLRDLPSGAYLLKGEMEGRSISVTIVVP